MTNETPSNETPSNGTTQSLTFENYINQQIQVNRRLLPRANSLAKETIDTYLDVLGVIETLDPEKPDKWYGKTAAIVEAVMKVMPKLDPKKVETAVANDMASLFRGFKPLNVGGAGR